MIKILLLFLIIMTVVLVIFFRNHQFPKNSHAWRYIISVMIIVIVSLFGASFIDIYPVPEGNLKSLETVVEFFQKNNLWHIKAENNWYIFVNKNEREIKNMESNLLVVSLTKNNISFVYQDSSKYTYFDIMNSNKIYVFNSGWFHVKPRELVWVWKVSKIINNNWIVLDKCTRTNCPELDK